MQTKKEMEAIKNLADGLQSVFKAESGNGDLSNFTTAGVFQGNVFTDTPPGASNGYGFLVVIARNETNVCQIYLDRDGLNIYFRFRTNSEWKGWKKVSAAAV